MGNINKVVQIPNFIKGLARKEIHVATGPLSTAARAPLGVPVQSHRPTEGGCNHRRSSNPTFYPKQDLQEQVAQCPAQSGFEYLQDQRLLNLSGQVVPVLTSKRDLFFLMCKGISCILVCACCFLSCHWAALRRFGSVFFITSLLLLSGIYKHWLVKISQSFFSPDWKEWVPSLDPSTDLY